MPVIAGPTTNGIWKLKCSTSKLTFRLPDRVVSLNVVFRPSVTKKTDSNPTKIAEWDKFSLVIKVNVS